MELEDIIGIGIIATFLTFAGVEACWPGRKFPKLAHWKTLGGVAFALMMSRNAALIANLAHGIARSAARMPNSAVPALGRWRALDQVSELPNVIASLCHSNKCPHAQEMFADRAA